MRNKEDMNGSNNRKIVEITNRVFKVLFELYKNRPRYMLWQDRLGNDTLFAQLLNQLRDIFDETTRFSDRRLVNLKEKKLKCK